MIILTHSLTQMGNQQFLMFDSSCIPSNWDDLLGKVSKTLGTKTFRGGGRGGGTPLFR